VYAVAGREGLGRREGVTTVHTRRRPIFLAAAVMCFVIAAVALTGVVLSGDLVGRLLFGAVWIALGIVWLGAYLGAFFGRS
jgi:hypothetical protein